MYISLSHFAVYLKLTQHCKLKIKKRLKIILNIYIKKAKM